MSQNQEKLAQTLREAVALLKKDASLEWAQYIDNDSSLFRLRVRVATHQVLSGLGMFRASADVIAARIRVEPGRFLVLDSPGGSDDFFWKFVSGQAPDADISDFIQKHMRTRPRGRSGQGRQEDRRLSRASDELTTVVREAIALLKKDASLEWAQYIDDESSIFRLCVQVGALHQVLTAQGLIDASAQDIVAKIRCQPREFLSLTIPGECEAIFWKVMAGHATDFEIVEFPRKLALAGHASTADISAFIESALSRNRDRQSREELESFNSKGKGDAAMC